MSNGGGFCELFLLEFGDNHDLGVLLIPAGLEIVQYKYIMDESNRNSNTLPSCFCVVASPASLLCEPKINSIGQENLYVRECYYSTHSSPFSTMEATGSHSSHLNQLSNSLLTSNVHSSWRFSTNAEQFYGQFCGSHM